MIRRLVSVSVLSIIGLGVMFLASGLRGQSARGVVTGQILSVEGTPAVGERVVLMEVASDLQIATALAIVQTDNDGRYRFEGIPPGRYHILAGPFNLPTYHPGVANLKEAFIVTVLTDALVEGVDFQMLPGPPRPVPLTGSVIVEEGGAAPAPLLPQLSGANRSITIGVEPSGAFFAAVPPGEYAVTFGLRPSIASAGVRVGISPLPPPYKVSSITFGADVVRESIRLAAGDDSKRLEIRLDAGPGSTVRGAVIGAPGASVVLTPGVESRRIGVTTPGFSLETTGAADGAFEFRKVPAGMYTLTARAVNVTSTPTVVMVAENEVIVEVALRVPVRGRVIVPAGASPPASFNLTLERGAELTPLPVRIGADGTFTATVPAGEYRVTSSGIPDYFVESIVVDSVSSENVLDSVVKVALDSSPWTVNLSSARVRVRGHVSDIAYFPKAATLSSGALNLLRAAPTPLMALESLGTRPAAPRGRGNLGRPTTAIRADGSFEFPDVPSGRYRLIPVPEFADYTPPEIVVTNKDVTAEVALPPHGHRLLKIVTDNNSMAPNLEISFTGGPDNKTYRFTFASTVNRTQPVTTPQIVTLPAGEYQVDARNFGSLFDLKSISAGDTNLLSSPLRIAAGELDTLTVTLIAVHPDIWFKVSGKLNGQASPDTSLTLTQQSGQLSRVSSTTIAADGSFQFSAVLAGLYALEPSPPIPGLAGMPLVVTDKDVSGVEFTIPPQANVRFVVENAPPLGMGIALNGGSIPGNIIRIPGLEPSAPIPPVLVLESSVKIVLGTYRLTVTGNLAAFKLKLKSFKTDQIDLRTEPLRLTESNVEPIEVRVVFEPE